MSTSTRIFKSAWFAKAARKALIYDTALYEAVHQSAQALFRIGAIDKATLRDFDATCFAAPPSIEPEQIRATRAMPSEPRGLARLLNISASTVQKWESGAKRPGGSALKLLDVVSKHGADVLHA